MRIEQFSVTAEKMVNISEDTVTIKCLASTVVGSRVREKVKGVAFEGVQVFILVCLFSEIEGAGVLNELILNGIT